MIMKEKQQVFVRKRAAYRAILFLICFVFIFFGCGQKGSEFLSRFQDYERMLSGPPLISWVKHIETVDEGRTSLTVVVSSIMHTKVRGWPFRQQPRNKVVAELKFSGNLSCRAILLFLGLKVIFTWALCLMDVNLFMLQNQGVWLLIIYPCHTG